MRFRIREYVGCGDAPISKDVKYWNYVLPFKIYSCVKTWREGQPLYLLSRQIIKTWNKQKSEQHKVRNELFSAWKRIFI